MIRQSVLILLLLVVFTHTAAGGEISVKINGTVLDTDVAPVLIDGRVLVPVRAIFDALGASVLWMSRTRTVLGQGSNSIIALTIDSPTADVYSCTDLIFAPRSVTLDVPAMIIDGRTLVPLRFISESLGAAVGYDAQHKIATVNGWSQAPSEPTWQFQQLVDEHEQAGITKPGPKPPHLAHYTFGHGPIAVAVTAHHILQSIAVTDSYLEPGSGYQWLLVRISTYNNGDQVHTVNPEDFYVTVGGHTIYLNPHYSALDDHFTTVHLSSNASSGGLLLFAVPPALTYRFTMATDTSLNIDIEI